jgi:hypothetical protein
LKIFWHISHSLGNIWIVFWILCLIFSFLSWVFLCYIYAGTVLKTRLHTSHFKLSILSFLCTLSLCRYKHVLLLNLILHLSHSRDIKAHHFKWLVRFSALANFLKHNWHFNLLPGTIFWVYSWISSIFVQWSDLRLC